MITSKFQELALSRLGFGTMRLPQNTDGGIDEKQVDEMIDYAIAHGVNYFDTAYPYHGGMSEIVVGRSLSRYPRESWYLADKFPGHQVAETYDPAAVFEEQMKKCGVEYFDFYLLHNVYENSIDTYTDERWGILKYFVEQKKAGRIKHLGFSCHGRPETLEKFLDYAGSSMEFCQIQLNYLDWTLQRAQEKYELLTERNIPVWVMEPVRGGKLAALSPENSDLLRGLRPDEKDPAWAFRFLLGLPNVKMILSGMSNPEQMKENVSTFSEDKPLSVTETNTLLSIADGMKNAIPCTACRYCTESCPQGLDIPMLIAAYNDLKIQSSMTVPMQLDALPKDKKPSACLACGACAKMCPQSIDIPAAMKNLAECVAKMPSWAEMCRQREEAAKKSKV